MWDISAMFPRHENPVLLSLAIALAPFCVSAAEIDFNRDIRPILNGKCIKCHGGVKEAGELNLQFREKALGAGESGDIAIVPGDPDLSEFIRRLTAEDKSERMPKKEAALPAKEIALLRQWVTEGAEWQNHWAYENPVGLEKGIDEIVSTKLKSEKLDFSPEADVLTLARRMALDVTGIPPEPARVDALEKAVEADKEKALSAFADELLASPSYGEKWAVPWLDIARYADSRGYEKDISRDMWIYRDWVISSLNLDMGYDRFITEQLAGDLLPAPSEEQIIATAFHRNTPQNDEGGTDDEEFRTYAVMDRLSTTFDGIQGTTMACVQCHGHPYDPFLHHEYYKLLAFFNNTADADKDNQAPTRKFLSSADVERNASIQAKIAGLEKANADEAARPESHEALSKWLVESQTKANDSALNFSEITATSGDFKLREDGRVRLEGNVPERTTITLSSAPVSAERTIASLTLEAIADSTLPGSGPGGTGTGNFIVTRVRASVISGGAETPLEVKSATASYEQGGWPIIESIREAELSAGEGESGWAISGGTGKNQTANYLLALPATLAPGTQLRVVIECENARWTHHVLASFRVSAGATDAIPEDIRSLMAKPKPDFTPEESRKLNDYFYSNLIPEYAARVASIATLREEIAAIPVCDLPIMQELEGSAARKTQVFHRGNWLDKAEEVQPGTPEILNPWHEDYPKNRLGLAMWLTNGENPLTARVQVNRVWEQVFGIGLVETLEDFGSQGDIPIYQDLLDTLALRFQGEMKWSQKSLLKEILLSRTYRQSSKATQTSVERDPANRLLARGPRFRLSNEQLRDQALAVAGILSRKMFGKPVMPFQPLGTWLTPYSEMEWTTSPAEDARRRAIYTLIRRSATYPSMVTFDAPNREFCLVRRTRTNTPLQALDLMNSPVFMEAAAALAKGMTDAGGSLEEQIAHGISQTALRDARPDEIAILKKLHTATGGSMTLVANAILNLDEILNKN